MSVIKRWEKLSDTEKSSLRKLKPVFILAPRSLSYSRIVLLLKESLSHGPVVFGVAKEPYIAGFENQSHFQSLSLLDVSEIAEAVAARYTDYRLTVLEYPQEETELVARTLRPGMVFVVRGSYQYAFHNSAVYRYLVKRSIPFRYLSPFVDEDEARQYCAHSKAAIALSRKPRNNTKIFELVNDVSKLSFDYSFQVGAVLAERQGSSYIPVDAACNEVVPYQTYAMHFGNQRELHEVAPQSDSNRYDTIHAEMNLLIRAVKQRYTLDGKSLFINLLPCPSCARTLAKSGLKEVIYRYEYSDGYSATLLEKCNIRVRRVE